MFNNLSDRLSHTISKLRGIGRLTEDNIKETVSEVRRALIEADVALSVITDFTHHIKEKALGQEVIKNIRPGDAFVKLVQDELTHILGDQQTELNLKAQRPVVILMSGLQGSGKTTTAAKLAKLLHDTHQKKVLLASTDVYRPAAIDQLQMLSTQINVAFFPSLPTQQPLDIAHAALDHAKKQQFDVVIIDTAGRLHIDEALMSEITTIKQAILPTEILLVVDSMTGQDAANSAKAFNDQLDITGVILTKIDGDARGGAALSMRMITGKPIKFVGVGEKLDALEPFYPERIASRILGMGDIVSLVEQAGRVIDKKEADKIAQKIKKGKRFDFNDFLHQLQQMKKMGGMKALLGKLPGVGALPAKAEAMMDEKLLLRMEAIIYSMTKKERQFPALVDGSRKRRIATGSGTEVQDVNKLLKQFTQMQKMLQRFKGDKMANKLKQLQSQLPLQ
jgi:signal recognition particle subunit SRP54